MNNLSMHSQTEDQNLKTPLTFTAEEADSTLKIEKYNVFAPTLNLEYNLNDSGWTAYTQGNTIILANVGDKVQLRATEAGNETFSSSLGYNQFIMTGKIAAAGNIQSVLDRTLAKTDVPEFCYYRMFYNCASLTQAPALPATMLADSCYCNMFRNCSSLTQAPALPATTLADKCYFYMFTYCTSLTKAPELPAAALADDCYTGMFYGCAALTQAPALPAMTLTDYCYESMFRNCTSLTRALAMPATALAFGCYSGMFYNSKVTSIDMKKSAKGVYDELKHGTLNSGIAINYVLD